MALDSATAGNDPGARSIRERSTACLFPESTRSPVTNTLRSRVPVPRLCEVDDANSLRLEEDRQDHLRCFLFHEDGGAREWISIGVFSYSNQEWPACTRS